MLLCANNVCSYRGEGSAFALCERCSPRLAPLLRDRDALLALYRQQASVGCAAAQCKNPVCRLAPSSGGGGEEGEAQLLQHLCSITTLYVCVPDHARLAVPPLPPQLARARRSSVAAAAPAAAGSAGAGAARKKKSVASAFF